MSDAVFLSSSTIRTLSGMGMNDPRFVGINLIFYHKSLGDFVYSIRKHVYATRLYQDATSVILLIKSGDLLEICESRPDGVGG